MTHRNECYVTGEAPIYDESERGRMGETSVQVGAEAGSGAAEGSTPALRRGVLGLPHAIVISVAVMSPAASVFFNTIPQAQIVGAAIPFCYVVGFVVALLVANQYSELSRELPSSGSAYTFVTEGLGPRWGFLTGWIGLIALGLGAPYTFNVMSAFLPELVYRWFGVQLHWSVYFVAALAIVFFLSVVGIRESLRLDLVLLVFEISVCVVLAGLVLAVVGGKGGLSATPFTPASMPAGGDLTVGVVFAVLSFIGFETAATLGEETRHPHRNIPRAVYGSMILVGAFFVLMVYIGTVGYGIDNMVAGFGKDPVPFDTIARRYGGDGLAALIDVAGMLSCFSAALAIVNGGARILYALGRDGAMPRWLGTAHASRNTPVAAISLLCAIGIVCGLALGAALTPGTAYGFLGLLDAVFILLIWTLVNVACLRFFWRKRRAQFRFVRHGLVPSLGLLITAAIVILVLVGVSTSPDPSDPAEVVIPAIVGGWLLLGLIGLLFTGKRLVPAAPSA